MLIYGKFIFNKGANSIQWGNDRLFIDQGGNNSTSTYKGMKSDPFLIPHIKIKSNLIIDLSGKDNTIKLLGQNIGVNLCDLGLGNESLDITPKSQKAKKK